MTPSAREPFDAFTPLREAVTRLFDDGLISPDRLLMLGRTFPIDVIETGDSYIVEASLTGVKPEQVQITTTGNMLTIRVGHKARPQHEGETYLRHERFERPAPEMSRTVTLPAKINPDKVIANYEHGMLTVTVGKDEETKPKAIPVHVTKEKVER
jgi:HSP20 family protein